MKLLCFFIVLLCFSKISAQQLTGKQLLEKAIAYHDPNGNWKTFQGQLSITMEIPEKPNRESKIHIDLPNQYFSVKAKTQNKTTEYAIDKDSVTIIFNGEKNPSKEILKENKLSTERAKLFKNYYTYLYGLPMKLKDSGAIIHEKVESKTFKGKSYWGLKVSYTEDIGKDTWYFYFDKTTFAMEVYQFYHDESKNDGEYILLKGEEMINGIKMPKIRTWYFNKNDKLLGTDILSSLN